MKGAQSSSLVVDSNSEVRAGTGVRLSRPVLLLDDSLGAVDLKLRKEMQTELKNIRSKP